MPPAPPHCADPPLRARVTRPQKLLPTVSPTSSRPSGASTRSATLASRRTTPTSTGSASRSTGPRPRTSPLPSSPCQWRLAPVSSRLALSGRRRSTTSLLRVCLLSDPFVALQLKSFVNNPAAADRRPAKELRTALALVRAGPGTNKDGMSSAQSEGKAGTRIEVYYTIDFTTIPEDKQEWSCASPLPAGVANPD